MVLFPLGLPSVDGRVVGRLTLQRASMMPVYDVDADGAPSEQVGYLSSVELLVAGDGIVWTIANGSLAPDYVDGLDRQQLPCPQAALLPVTSQPGEAVDGSDLYVLSGQLRHVVLAYAPPIWQGMRLELDP